MLTVTAEKEGKGPEGIQTGPSSSRKKSICPSQGQWAVLRGTPSAQAHNARGLDHKKIQTESSSSQMGCCLRKMWHMEFFCFPNHPHPAAALRLFFVIVSHVTLTFMDFVIGTIFQERKGKKIDPFLLGLRESEAEDTRICRADRKR